MQGRVVMRHKCVILADSHQNMLEGIRGLLTTTFETVIMVADKNSLFKAAEDLDPDLAVVDLSLPVAGEVNVARELKNRHPELRLIILSVHDEPVAVEEVMAAGASAFVLKRSAATDLMQAVDEVSNGNLYVSPKIQA